MSKKIVVYFQNGYGIKFTQEFDNAEEYLIWKQKRPDEWNNRNEFEVLKITTRWLPLDWRGLL